MYKWQKPVGQAKHLCKTLGIPCEFATSLGYCLITVCVKVQPEVKRK